MRAAGYMQHGATQLQPGGGAALPYTAAHLRLLLALLLLGRCCQLGLPAPRLGSRECGRHAVQAVPCLL